MLTGAKVHIKIISKAGRVYAYDSEPLMKRSVKVQVGESGVQSVRTSTRVGPTHSPKKCVTFESNTGMRTPIANLPGKKKKEMSRRAKTDPANNRCNICKIIYNSKGDKAMAKQHKRQNVWLGCDHKDRDYWAHAHCANVKIPQRGKLDKIMFNCPAHTHV